MTFSNANLYLETSAVNYLADRFVYTDAIATKALQLTKGNIWYLSPVTLWEIMLTSDKERRERIIFYCQNLFHDRLLNSPSEFIVNYINAGCPLVEKRYDFHSKLSLSETWKDLVDDTRRTFDYDYKEFKKRMQGFQKLSKQIDKIINRIVLDTKVSDEELVIQNYINHYFSQIEKKIEIHDDNYKKVIKISILFMFYILSLALDMDNSAIENYWSKIGINEPFKRMDYLMQKYKGIVLRGPIYEMAIMAFHQLLIEGKTNRGLFMDCLHSIYITYLDIFLTNDEHFKTLKEREIHPNFSKLFHMSEIEFTKELKKIHFPKP